MGSISKYCLILCCFALLTTGDLSASHIVGGGIEYQCLGEQKFSIQLIVYRDCKDGRPWFDDPAYIAVFDGSSDTLVRSIGTSGFIVLPFDEARPLPKQNKIQCLNNPPGFCRHYTVYRDTVVLPKRNGGYLLSYQRCCRNQNVTNTTSEGSINFMAKINSKICNSSPSIAEHKLPLLCVGRNIDWKFEAYDADGDSLRYQLITPLTGRFNYPDPESISFPPYEPIRWWDEYQLTNLIGGEPLSIASSSGQLSGIPNMTGTFLIGLAIEEYRNGQFLGKTRIDLQLEVISCDYFKADFILPKQLCEGEPVELMSSTTNASLQQWTIESEDGLDTTIHAASTILNDLPAGSYSISLHVENGRGCTDSLSHNLNVLPSPEDQSFEIERISCQDFLRFQLQPDIEQIQDLRVQWYIAPQDTQIEMYHPVISVESDSFKVRMRLSVDGQCVHEVTREFATHIIAQDPYPDTLNICRGDSTSVTVLRNISVDSIAWFPSYSLSETSIAEPIAFPDTTTRYSVFMNNSFGCQRRDTVLVRVHSPPDTFELTADKNDIDPGEQVLIQGPVSSDYTYYWSIDGRHTEHSKPSFEVSPKKTTSYGLIISNQYGCIKSDSIVIYVKETNCHPPEIFLPNAFSPNGDGVNDVLIVRGKHVKSVRLLIYNRWGELVFESRSQNKGWDGTTNGRDQPMGTYAYSLSVRCYNGKQVYRDEGSIYLHR